jgi:hypothetical protein
MSKHCLINLRLKLIQIKVVLKWPDSVNVDNSSITDSQSITNAFN